MSDKIDIFLASYLRPQYTGETIRYLRERTKYPYRLFLLDNGGNEQYENQVDYYIGFSKNMGIHALWNTALALAESEYFITSDNDIYVPDLTGYTDLQEGDEAHLPIKKYLQEDSQGNVNPDWLTRMVGLMDERPDYGAISLHPHIFIGIAGEDPNDPEDVKEAPMAGAVMRIMHREVVIKAGGWDRKIEAGRNHEERTICSRLQQIGYKVGRTTRIRAYHPFGKREGLPWGYPKEFTPEMQGHNPDLVEEVWRFDNPEAYDQKTWMPL